MELPLSNIQIEYLWVAGSMPPPYHYEYAIRIGPGSTGTIEFCPDYPSDDTPTWLESFSVDETNLNLLQNMLQQPGILQEEWQKTDNFTVGGSMQWAKIKLGDGQFSIPAKLHSADERSVFGLYDFIRSLVPDKIMARLNSRRQEYENNYNS